MTSKQEEGPWSGQDPANHVSKQVLGREVYTSNNQLGGVQIMHNNGVSHVTVPDDFEGVYTILEWLSYMPKVRPPTPAAESPGTLLLSSFPVWRGSMGSGEPAGVAGGISLYSSLLPSLTPSPVLVVLGLKKKKKKGKDVNPQAAVWLDLILGFLSVAIRPRDY